MAASHRTSRTPVASRVPTALLLAAAVAAAPAAALSPPTVDENMGTLSFRYPFAVPAARGRYQPAVELEYDSEYAGFGWNTGFGWYLSTMEAFLGRDWDDPDPNRLYYIKGKEKKLLRQSTRQPGEYAVDVEEGYMAFRKLDAATWEGVDAAGNRLTFAAAGAANSGAFRLTRIIDPDNNATRVYYDANGLLESIQYNAYSPGATSPTNPVDGPFATVISFEYGTGTTGYTGVRLRNVRVKNATPQGLTTVRRYELTYSSYDRYTDSGWQTY